MLKSTQKLISVCCVLPNFTVNGVSRWLISLAKLGPTHGFKIDSICLPEAAPTDTALCRELKLYGTHIFATNVLHDTQNATPAEEGLVLRVASEFQKVLRSTTTSSDVLMWYGVPNGSATLRQCGSDRLVVPVSHGPSEFTKSWVSEVREASTRAVGVSACCIPDFQHFGIVEILFNGIDLNRATPSKPRAICRRDLGITSEETLLVGHVGRLSLEKNPSALCLGVDYLRTIRQHPNVKAIWVGGGQDEHEFKKTVTKCLPTDAYLFIKETQNVANIYEALDCYVLASEREGFSLAVTEAWANGVPTVCTPVGAIPELEALAATDLCVKVPVNPSGEELGEAILHATLRKDIRNDAMNFARTHLTEDVMVRRWSKFFQKLLTRNGRN